MSPVPVPVRTRRRAAPPPRPHLALVDAAAVRSASRRRLRARVALVSLAGLAVASLLGMAALHAVLMTEQVELDRLEELVAEERAVHARNRLEVSQLEAPRAVVRTAKERLGMVPAGEPVYLSPSDDVLDRVARGNPGPPPTPVEGT